jgi:hypothetical protein
MNLVIPYGSAQKRIHRKRFINGLLRSDGKVLLKDQCTWEEEAQGLLQVIFEDGNFYNQTTLTKLERN